ncbi:nucleotidyltransferase family protein [Streptomyces physcomitrii]|uniref:Nucleotidyltransferase family protein n=1 Tax=Streptomyces physcomitrii TaxID=2724184 RepID=A0ABX1HAD0_9ACTN|nr:nucleotidyltransferase family protein [Streptomyces physcomitrii]NKI44159.1 nucleotidyltransferase family protein [Streptomyces physcomitrii]
MTAEEGLMAEEQGTAAEEVTAAEDGADFRELSSEYLADLLRAVERSHEPSWMAVFRYASRHKLRIVLASALLTEGYPLTPGLAYEVSFWREQEQRYGGLVGELTRAVPELRRMKGPEIGRLYPPGWLRDSTDVDLVARTPRQVWEAAGHLRDQGWQPDSLAFQGTERGVDVALNMVRPSHDELLLDHQAVELVSMETTGRPWRVRPVSDPPGVRRTGPARQLLALLEEGFERDWRARDLLDASLLLVEITEEGVPALAREVDALGLGRQWHTLTRRLRGYGLVDDALLPAPGRPWRASAQRLRRAASLASRPPAVAAGVLQTLQRRKAEPLGSAGERWLLDHLPGRSVLAAGLPVWGVRVGDRCAEGTEVAYRTRSGRTYATTPVGTYLLLYVPHFDPSWLHAPSPVSGQGD